MEKKSVATEEAKIKSRFTLPPNVNGRCRGRLSLCLHEIQWSTAVPIQFNWIEARFLWWGNKYHSAATLKLKCKNNQKKSIGHAIHYNILTKLTLFRKYLLSSENLVVKFASGISNIEIGEAIISIPEPLIEFIDSKSRSITSSQQLTHSISQTIGKYPMKSLVFDAQQKIIGEISMDFEMIVYNRVLNEMELEMGIETEMLTSSDIVPNNDVSPMMDQQFEGIENNMNQFNLDFNRTNVNKKVHESRISKHEWSLRPQIIDNDKFLPQERSSLSLSSASKQRLSSKTTNVSSPLLNYLTGRPLHAAEETEAVRAMTSTSPTESLIDQLSYDLSGLYLRKKSTVMDIEANVLRKIDCMRIHINELCLSRAGIREILSKENAPNEMSFGSGTFTVSIDIDPILLATTKSPFEKNVTFASKVTRIFDTSIEIIPPAIEINQSSVHKLNASCIKSRNANGRISVIVQYRDIESSVARTLGTAQFQFRELIQATNFVFQQHCPVTIASSEIICGRLSVKAELGCRGLHFGADFLEAISIDSINTIAPLQRQLMTDTDNFDDCYNCNHSSSTHHCCCLLQTHNGSTNNNNNNDDNKYELYSNGLWFDDINDLCAYDIHDEQTEDKSQTPSATALNTETQSTTTQTNGNNTVQKSIDGIDGKEHSLKLNEMDELSSNTDENTLNGLLHVGQINYCSWYQSTAETFLVCRPFWIADTALVTENCPHKMHEENYQLNYLELFSVICDQKLIDATKHGFMSIEIWQRDSAHKIESLVGSAKMPLHQFYIAFNNNIIRSHVSKQELPVVSIDGWITIAYTALPDSTPVGTVQAILAVGTTKQINNLKKSKSLLSCNSFLRYPLELYAPQSNHIGAAETKGITNRTEANNTAQSSNGIGDCGQSGASGERHNNLTTMFSTFIDNLAARLPDRNSSNSNSTETTATSDATTQTIAPISDICKTTTATSGKYMRPTSELLEDLQRALAIAPTAGQKKGYGLTPITISEQKSTTNNETVELSKSTAVLPPKMFRVHIEIENALHLPTFAIPPNKKGAKRNRNNLNADQSKCNGKEGVGSGGNTTLEIEPNTYVTFEAAATNVPSNSTTYTTNIIETSCSPRWNKQFEVYLPAEYLQNDEKRFEIRVWRKVGDNTSKMRLIPNPSNDVTIGLVTVDLTVLIAGLPFISGWFNIIDHSGCINGQLKIHIKPKDDLLIYQKRNTLKKSNDIINCFDSTVPNKSPATNMKTMDPVDPVPSNNVVSESSPEPAAIQTSKIDDSALSRALKRKFTELEEITQRLRARLFDVTGNMTIDPDDQYYTQMINTIPDEGDDNFEESNMASEMSLDWLEHCHNQASAAAAAAAVATTVTAFNELDAERNFHVNDHALSTAQMRDIFEYLSTTESNPSRLSLNDNDEQDNQEQSIESLPDKLSSRFIEVINEEKRTWSNTSSIDDGVENSVDNIAESLQKSLIND